jgi:hypothetical protein
MGWQPPTITVKWGPYFPPDADEEQKIVTTTQQALGGGVGGGTPIITLRSAVEKIAPIFGIENIEAVLDDLEKAAEEKRQKEQDAALTEQQNLHDLANGKKPGGAGGAGGTKPKTPASGGIGGGSAVAPKA